ncbi:hypothetical protein Tco_1151376 [Tanacetum coccineum]
MRILNRIVMFDYLEEMDLKWQVAIISMRLNKFYKKTGRKVHFDAKEPIKRKSRKQKERCREYWIIKQKTMDGDWENRRSTDTDWSTSCSKESYVESYDMLKCMKSYAKLKKLYDQQREQLGNASIEIQTYTQALKKMSARDKSRLGYGNEIHEGVLSYENKVLESMFNSRSSDVKDSHVNDRFANVEGMHAVPPLMTRIYMPPKSDIGIDESYDFASCESNSTIETSEFVPKPAINEPKAVSKPKVWSDAPIIEEYESDSNDEYVIKPSKEQEKPSCAFVNSVKHVKTPRETIKEQNTCSRSPKADKRD